MLWLWFVNHLKSYEWSAGWQIWRLSGCCTISNTTDELFVVFYLKMSRVPATSERNLCLYLWRSEEGWKLICDNHSFSRQSVSFPCSSYLSVICLKRSVKRRSVLPHPPSRLPSPHLVSSLLNAEAAARRLQQQHEVQLCQECDSSDPLVFLLVSPLSPYCQSEECTSVEMSLWDTTEDVEALQFQNNTKTRSHRSWLLGEKQPSLTS